MGLIKSGSTENIETYLSRHCYCYNIGKWKGNVMRWPRIKLFWRAFSCPVESLAIKTLLLLGIQAPSPLATTVLGLFWNEDSHCWWFNPVRFKEQLTKIEADVLQLFCKWLREKDDSVGGEKEETNGMMGELKSCGGSICVRRSYSWEGWLRKCTHIGTHRERLIYKITMHETHAHICAHTRRSRSLKLPEFYWGVMKRVVGCKRNDADGVFHCVKHFSICVLCIILASQAKCKNTVHVTVCMPFFFLLWIEYLCGLHWEWWLWCCASY